MTSMILSASFARGKKTPASHHFVIQKTATIIWDKLERVCHLLWISFSGSLFCVRSSYIKTHHITPHLITL